MDPERFVYDYSTEHGEKIFFDGKEEKKRIEIDADLNGKMDTWQYFRHGYLVRVETDGNDDGKIDLKAFYENEKK